MFKDKKTSKAVLDELEKSSRILNDSLSIAQEGGCDKEWYKIYKNLVAFSMGYIYTNIMRAIHKKHPELEPKELRIEN